MKVTRDLTERKEAEERLRRSEERLRLMVAAVKDYAIFMLDPDGNIASWNEGARRFKGYEANEVIGTHFSRFYTEPDKNRDHPQYELKKAREEGRYEEEGWRVRKDGTQFWANVVITRVNDESGKLLGYVKVTRDLTDKKKSEEQLKTAYNNLEQRVQDRTRELQDALKIRDEFLSIASHELKTPLTSLKLQLQVSQKRIENSPEDTPLREVLLQSFNVGVRQINSLDHLVEDLLDVSRIQTGVLELEREEMNLSELVEDIANRFKEQTTRANSTLELKLDKLIKGQWDRYRIEQVIVNLINNALKYAPGPVVIETRRVDGMASFSVTDKGPGIPKDKIDAIFNRFERGNSDKNIGGMGLGLFISKKIVEHHGGTISVNSQLGHGSTFVVKLPLK